MLNKLNIRYLLQSSQNMFIEYFFTKVRALITDHENTSGSRDLNYTVTDKT